MSTKDLIKHKDLSVTALYTAHTWDWAGFPYAHIFANDQTHGVFSITNLFIWLAHLLKSSPPSLPHSLLQRHSIIDQVVQRSSDLQVIELASGLSARALRCTDLFSTAPLENSEKLARDLLPSKFCHFDLKELKKRREILKDHKRLQRNYFEVDLPHVIEHKKSCILNYGQTLGLEDVSLLMQDSSITWQGLDIKQDDLAWVPPQKSIFIAEGLCMYLNADEQRSLWQKIYHRLSEIGGGTFVFDLVPTCEQPQPGIMGKILRSLMRLFTGGQSFIVDQRGRLDLCQELVDIGFEHVQMIDPSDKQTHALYHVPVSEISTQQLLFIMQVAPKSMTTD
jgi:hypothetical protein